MKLWEGLEQELNFNVMVSQRGVLNLCHSDAQRDAYARRGNAMRMNGVDAELLDVEEVRRLAPFLDFEQARFPIQGGLLQRRGGTARHDAVVWGYARAASDLGVDIIENCEVTGIRRDAAGAVEALETTRGVIRTPKVGVAAAAHTSVLLGYAGIRLPLECFPLQALVSDPVQPLMPCVVMSNTIHAYMSQSDKGELVIGAGTDAYNSYTQRGALHINTHTLESICELFPMVRRMKMMRNWAGTVDVTPDRSPIVAKTPVKGLYVNCGWGTGGFKATPGSAHLFAWTIAHDEPHPINAPFTIERFRDGLLIDEAAAAAVAH
jgi:sarcosine oxidase subunit beta